MVSASDVIPEVLGGQKGPGAGKSAPGKSADAALRGVQGQRVRGSEMDGHPTARESRCEAHVKSLKVTYIGA